MKIQTLKRPAQFKRVRGGVRWAGPLFIIEGRRRGPPGPESVTAEPAGPRFGFTITRKVGSAVVRNRIRRRLREALRTLVGAQVRQDYDYVVVASRAAHDYPFAGLQDALRDAFERLHKQADSGQGRVGQGQRHAKGRRGGARPSVDSTPDAGVTSQSSVERQSGPSTDKSNSGSGRR